MALNLSTNNEVLFFPDFKIGEELDNSTRVENKMGFALKRPNRFLLRQRALEKKYDSNGNEYFGLNEVSLMKMMFIRFINPIKVTLNGGAKRDLEFDDIFLGDVFSELLAEIYKECVDLASFDKGPEEKKS